MPRTPDYFPGDREEEGLLFISGSELPSKNGEVRYVSGSGFKFYEEGVIRTLSSSAGISSDDHKSLRQLIHFIDSGPASGFGTGSYMETLPVASPFPTSYVWWDSAAKLRQIVRLEVTRSAGFLPIIENWKMFDSLGSLVVETVSDSISYSGVFETSRSRAVTP